MTQQNESFTAFVEAAPFATPAAAGDIVPIIQGGVTKRISPSSLLTQTGVTPGSYANANITVGADGRLTGASNGSSGGGGGGATAIFADLSVLYTAYAAGAAPPSMVVVMGFYPGVAPEWPNNSSSQGTSVGSLQTRYPEIIWQYVASDTSSPCNGGTIFVDQQGRRWYRQVQSEIRVAWFGSISDNNSHPLSSLGFATLAAAQVYYPAAAALTDEVDWCAHQAAANWAYNRSNDPTRSSQWVSAKFIWDGQSVVDKSVNVPGFDIKIVADGPMTHHQSALNGQGQTTITYNGAGGTVDAPIGIIQAALNAPPSVGGKGNSNGDFISLKVDGIGFYGLSGSSTGAPSTTGFVQGIQFGGGSFCEFSNCGFYQSIYDGIITVGPQLFCNIHNNFFEGVHRDAISILPIANDFSTTVWIRNNESGMVGRYFIFLDSDGAVEASHIIENNDNEGNFASWYTTNLNWYVCGVNATEVYINCSNSVHSGNRYEISAGLAGPYAPIHLHNTSQFTIRDTTCVNIILTCQPQVASEITSAASTYKTANGYFDVTDTRNYNAATVSDYQNTTEQLFFEDWSYNMGAIFCGYGALTGSGRSVFNNVGVMARFDLATVNGTYATLITPPATAAPAFSSINNTGSGSYFSIRDAELYDSRLGVFNVTEMFYSPGAQSGIYTMLPSTNFGSAWQANTVYHNSVCQYLGYSKVFVTPATENGYVYQCTTSGTSGGSAPSWPTTIGNTVTDGTVVWKCVATAATVADVGNGGLPEIMELGNRKRKSSAYNGGTSPTTWTPPAIVGDQALVATPASGGYLGLSCTVAGSPGTWHVMA